MLELLLVLLFIFLMNLSNDVEVGALNSKLDLDFLHFYKPFISDNSNYDPPTNDPYLASNLNCLYYEELSFMDTFSCYKEALVLNANIQSLTSKFNELKDFVLTLASKNVPVEVISLQEIWAIPDITLFNLPDYQELVFKTRSNCKGGGIGFFIKKRSEFFNSK